MIYNSLLEMIGQTPVVKLNAMPLSQGAEVYVKLEGKNPGGSIKDRAALGMIEDAEKKGKLKPGMTIVEPTSGNTGIAIAMIGALKGYKVVIIMPETMSIERRIIMKAYGAEILLTEGAKGMKGAIERASQLKEEDDNVFIPGQFSNPANPDMHYKTTAQEILNDFERLDVFVAGVGTSGTISGVGKRLKEERPFIKIVAVEPANSPVISGGQPGSHKIQGIGAGFVTALYNQDVVDQLMTVEDDDAYQTANRLAREEGLFLGISAAANVAAALKIAAELGPDAKVLTVAPDSGDKYLSMNVFRGEA
ncbi:cysteine synthase A [Acidaminobacter hydrogenoformans]|uniref:Cysteine synthase n=1 Tax=Acidaminobacter hydrogenoformans DSM 2784 TaxID=1120920 RepID=A0A1G5RTF0_9FIRM|nr:cysteine synthase A [Acidaminobacter hydrogenoformans]SCZ77118.1 cysteine synthase A [Acidaminobacter hydrogenoformans DSM 2784]